MIGEDGIEVLDPRGENLLHLLADQLMEDLPLPLKKGLIRGLANEVMPEEKLDLAEGARLFQKIESLERVEPREETAAHYIEEFREFHGEALAQNGAALQDQFPPVVEEVDAALDDPLERERHPRNKAIQTERFDLQEPIAQFFSFSEAHNPMANSLPF